MMLCPTTNTKKQGVDVATLDNALVFDINHMMVIFVSRLEGAGKTMLVNWVLAEDPRFLESTHQI